MRYGYRSCLAVFVSLTACTSVHAINIVPVFNSTDNETPGFDIFNQGIQDLMDYAEGYYEDMIEDPSERYEYDKHYYTNAADLYSWDTENVRITCESISGTFFTD